MITPIMPVYNRANLSFERGEGPYLFTADGKRYLDFAAGIAVNAFGHAHPYLVEKLHEQAKKLWHVSNIFRISEGERLAQRLCDATFADTVFFNNSGSEAWECGVKLYANILHTSVSHKKHASSRSKVVFMAAA